MKIGDKVKITTDLSRFYKLRGTIVDIKKSYTCDKTLCSVIFDDASVTIYKSLHFMEDELEVINENS